MKQESSDFLQSEEWRKFQEAFGRRTFFVCHPHPLPTEQAGNPLPQAGEGDFDFSASIIEHNLPIVGNYFYIPRGPIIKNQKSKIKNQNYNIKLKSFLEEIILLSKQNKIGWVRFDPENDEMLNVIKNAVGSDLASAQKGQAQGLSLQRYKIVKAPHDVQPKELFVMDISKSEEEILAGMKPKARYNIRLAGKRGVLVSGDEGIRNEKYIQEFLRLTKVMAKRQGITAHPDKYYRKMLEIIPGKILRLYLAEYEGRIIAANLVVFYGDTAVYLHGASDDEYRNVMAPYLLQWQAIQDAKKLGCVRYDFGGIKTTHSLIPSPACGRRWTPACRRTGEGEVGEVSEENKWAGITKFKMGFSPETLPTEFPGSYDLIINPVKYYLYRMIQKVKSFLR